MRTHPTSQNEITLVHNGFEFIQAHIELIREAKHFILLHTYIFEEDETTKPVLNALTEANKKGVKIFILIDAFGSQDFPLERIEDFLKQGIHIKFFTPFFEFIHFGRRMHQKVLLVDNQKAIIGGINLARRFNNPDQDLPWLDYSCLIEGAEVHNIFLKIIKHYIKNFPLKKNQLISFKSLSHKVENQSVIKTIENDWMYRYTEITKSYLTAISKAQDEIIILATYFLPGKKVLKELKKARERGVNVKLIFSAMTDHPLVQSSEKYFFDWYWQQGFELYAWDKSIVHGKLALIDKKWCTIGSYNHNFLSKYGNLEINAEVINENFSKIIQAEFDSILMHSKPIRTEHYAGELKIFSFLTYILLNLLTLISLVFIYRRSEEGKENILK